MTANDIRARQSAGLPNDLRRIVAAWHRARNIDDVPTAESLRGEMLQAADHNQTPTHFVVTEDMLRNCESGE